MRVFLSEYLTCGASGEGPDSPLFPEGAAMLRALAADAARVPGVEVVVTWDARLPAFGVGGVEVRAVSSPGEEEAAYCALAAECDAALHVAPEFRDLLARRAETVLEVGGRWLGCSPHAIRVCADKPTFVEFFTEGSHSEPPLRSAKYWRGRVDDSRPAIFKPRFGAGGDGLVVRDHAAFRDRRKELFAEAKRNWPPGDITGQQFIEGEACSAAVIGRHTLPAGRQVVDTDGPICWVQYRGGWITTPGDVEHGAADLAFRVRRAVPGLAGWWGIDFVLPDDPADPAPVLIEVNPRLTTSYLGYRALTPDNLAERILFPDRAFRPPRWNPGTVMFDKDGRVRVER